MMLPKQCAAWHSSNRQRSSDGLANAGDDQIMVQGTTREPGKAPAEPPA
jgi:hypothetical protein